MAFCKSLSRSKMHFNGNFMSRGVKMDVCGLDHSGSQSFNFSVTASGSSAERGNSG